MPADIYIEKTNASKVKLYITDEGISRDIYEFFMYDKPGFKKNKWTRWDGRVRLFSQSSGSFPYGCIPMLHKLAKERGWKLELDERFKEDIVKVEKDELEDWVKSLDLVSGGNKIEPYEYQFEALYLAVKYSRLCILAATSAGKSLIAYMLTRYYEMCLDQDKPKKILIIVPSQNLVTQMYSDFQDYSTKNGWSVADNVHYIMEGRPKNARKLIYISTWQSIYEEKPDYFEQFGYIIEDEVHGASGDSIGNILGNSINAYKRVGMTGTLRNDKINPLMVSSHFGIIKRVVSTKELIDAGRATATNITMLQLDYPEEERQVVKTTTYQGEIEFLISHAYRNKIIENLARTLKGNTLILFDRVDAHLKKVEEALLRNNDLGKRQVFVISGSVENEHRNEIKKAVEAGMDIVILATYGTMSTGVSIKKLHNLVFAHPSKAIVRVLQSIGRLLRLHETKDTAYIYDLVDNLNVPGRPNFALKHALERLGFYKSEKHPVKSRKIVMKSHEEVIRN